MEIRNLNEQVPQVEQTEAQILQEMYDLGIDMVLVDEADQGGSKQYQNVITRLFNTRVYIPLS